MNDAHDTLYEAYQDYLSGDKNVLYKMKEFWNNAAVTNHEKCEKLQTSFSDHEKYAKKIRKVQTLKNYETGRMKHLSDMINSGKIKIMQISFPDQDTDQIKNIKI